MFYFYSIFYMHFATYIFHMVRYMCFTMEFDLRETVPYSRCRARDTRAVDGNIVVDLLIHATLQDRTVFHVHVSLYEPVPSPVYVAVLTSFVCKSGDDLSGFSAPFHASISAT